MSYAADLPLLNEQYRAEMRACEEAHRIQWLTFVENINCARDRKWKEQQNAAASSTVTPR